VPKETRQHKTVSGGWHLMYRLPKGYGQLPSRANIVKGMDSRGRGGWIAFGEGYKLINDAKPALLTVAACEELLRGTNKTVTEVTLEGYDPPSPTEQAVILAKLNKILAAEQLIYWRWHGNTAGLGETGRSRSAMDFSMAHKLSMVGFETNEIIWLLLCQFEHGQCRWMDNGRVALRAAQRCASKAKTNSKELLKNAASIAASFNQPATSEDVEAAMAAALAAMGKR